MAKKILIVDDEPDLVKMLNRRLASNGYEVMTASNGAEAMARAKDEKPDLIILDVLMPQMTGYQFVQKLREQSDSIKDIPVVVISAKLSMKEFFNPWEIHTFMPKPFEPEKLMSIVDEILHAVQHVAFIQRCGYIALIIDSFVDF